MSIPEQITQSVTNASAKALATDGPAGLNVVPVSVVTVTEKNILLYNFFMNKTVQNIVEQDTPVALTCWNGLEGVQVHATATHSTTGEMYEAAQAEMQVQFPERNLQGIIVLTPTAYYDVSANSKQAGRQLFV